MAKDDHDFESFVQNRKSPPPETLYKYAPVDVARAILENGTLRFHSPTRFNDPFDSQWNPMWQARTEESGDSLFCLLKTALASNENWPPDIGEIERNSLGSEMERLNSLGQIERAEHLARLHSDLRGLAARDAASEAVFRDKVRRMRIFCVSAQPKSILLCAHYASSHTGVVLGFSSSLIESHFKRPLVAVKYEMTLPNVIDLSSFHRHLVFGTEFEPDFERIADALAYHKFSQWDYEAEWRIHTIAPEYSAGLYDDYTFPASCLTELSAASNTTASDFQQVVKWATSMGARPKMFRLVPSTSKFELEKIALDSSSDSSW